jgi:hypothetical protein
MMSIEELIIITRKSISLFFVLQYFFIFFAGYILGKIKGHAIGLMSSVFVSLICYYGLDFPLVALLGYSIYNFGSLVSTYFIGRNVGEGNFALSISVLSLPFILFPTLSKIIGPMSYPYLNVKILIFFILILFLISTFWNIRRQINLFINTDFQEKIRIVESHINITTYALFFFVLCYLNYTLVPVLNYDDLATHYFIQNQFSLGHYPSFDVSVHIWAVSQWVFDIFYGYFEYLFKNNGRAYLNSFLLLGISFVSFRILKEKFNVNTSLLITLLSMSSPLVVLSLTTSQTELVTLFLGVSIVFLWLSWKHENALASFPIFAFAIAIKPSNAVIFIFPFVIFVIRYIKEFGLNRLTNIKSLTILFFSIVIAFYVYIFAYYVASNPFFPLFNSIFQAPYYPTTDFFNAIYTGNFDLSAFWGLLFETSKYLESSNGVIGFQFIALPILILLVLFFYKSNVKLTIFLLSILIGGLSIFYSQQYARYIMPVLYLLPLLAVLFFTTRFSVLALWIIVPVFIGLNIIATPRVIWYLNDWNNTKALSESYQIEYRDNRETISRVNDYLNSLPGLVNSIYPQNKPYASNINDRYTYVNWYNKSNQDDYFGGADSILNLILKNNVSHIILNSNSSKDITDIASVIGGLVYQDVNYNVYEIGVPEVALTPSNTIVIGKPYRGTSSEYVVDKENYYVLEYQLNKPVRNIHLKMTLACNDGGIWKNYIEYNRYANFSNYLTIDECNKSTGELKVDYTILPPKGTRHLRIFIQPIMGTFSVNINKIEIH